MTEEEIELKRQTLILNTFDEKLTRRRIWQVVGFGGLFLVLVLGVGLYLRDPVWVTVAAVVYILITIREKVGYGYGVIIYKRVIRMLLTDSAALEKYKRLVKERAVGSEQENA